MLDGVDNNETWLQTVVIFPNVDALDEFKLQTSTYSAEFGKSLGGVVNLQIKSGSNAFHGSVYEFLRNDKFDANNFFNNRAGRDKPDFKQNQYGGTLGGPMFRDKTFFFGDYQGLRINSGATYLSTVPSVRMRNGDFGEINRVIYDPLTRQPFPNNVIPRDRWDPASANVIAQLYPEPEHRRHARHDRPADQQLPDQSDADPRGRPVRRQGRPHPHDHQPLLPRYSYQKTHRNLPATLPHGDAGATFGAGDGNINAQSLAFNDTQTLGSRWLNEFRFGWNSIKFFMTPIDYGTNPAAAVGIPGINLNEATSAMTQLMFQNIRNLGANSNQPLITNQNDFQIFDNVTWLKGRHTLKAGGSVTLRSREILNADTIVGNFGFNNNQTVELRRPGERLHDQHGDRLRRRQLPARVRRVEDAQPVRRRDLHREAARVRALRAGRLPADRQAHAEHGPALGRLRALDRGGRPPVELRRRRPASSSSRRTTRSSNGVEVGRYLQTYSKGDLAPRLGFAYDVRGNARTIIRGGFGVFWNFTPGGTSSSKAQNPPFLQSTALTTDGRRDHAARAGRPAAASGRRPEPAGVGHDALDLRHQLP